MAFRFPCSARSAAVVFTAAALAALMSACGEPPSPPKPPGGVPKVAYVTLQPKRLPLETELAGRTQSVLVAEVRPQVSGLVKERLFKEGVDVKAGQVLYRIDSDTYAANVANVQAAVARADAQVGLAELKARRTTELAAIKAVAQQDADDAATALKQARADAQSARAQLQTARIDLDRTRVTAPISGRIGRSNVTPGALVTASQATALATVQKLDPIFVDFTQSSNIVLLLERLMAEGKVKRGDAKVKLKLDDDSLYPQTGRLQFAEVSVDAGTGSVTLRAEFPNPDRQLLPGMYVRGIVEAGVVDEAMLVPQQAVTRDPDGTAIAYVVTADNKLEPRKVTTRRAIGDAWLVSDGVKPGDKIVVQGQDKAKPGAPVEARPYTPAASGGAASGAAAQGASQPTGRPASAPAEGDGASKPANS